MISTMKFCSAARSVVDFANALTSMRIWVKSISDIVLFCTAVAIGLNAGAKAPDNFVSGLARVNSCPVTTHQNRRLCELCEFECDGVHAVAEACGLGAVVEDMAEVGVTEAAVDGGAQHA